MTNNNELTAILELVEIIRFNKIFLLILALAALVGLVKIVQKLSENLQEILPLYRLVILQTSTVITFFLYIFGGGAITYSILKPPKELIIAVGGSAAVAIGFALKDLVGSFVAGIVLLFDRPFQVGDRVKYGEIYGEIVSIGLRAVRLKTLDDSCVTIPNIKFFTEVVTSGNSGSLDMMITVNFHLSLDAEIGKAKKLLYELVATSRYVHLKKPIKVVASEVEIAGRIAIQLKVKAYVLDVQYEKDFETDIVSRATHLFSSEKIQRPHLLSPECFGTYRNKKTLGVS